MRREKKKFQKIHKIFISFHLKKKKTTKIDDKSGEKKVSHYYFLLWYEIFTIFLLNNLFLEYHVYLNAYGYVVFLNNKLLRGKSIKDN